MPLLVLYRVLRKPSVKQARIREVVSGQLGAFSDSGDWPAEIAVPVAATYGATGSPGDLLDAAERQLSHGDVAMGLMLTRLALAVSEGKDAGLARDAKSLTDECLRRLPGNPR